MSFDYYSCVDASELKGHGFSRIDVTDDTLTFYGMKGEPLFQMCHNQDCCESVYLAEVIGDISDLLDTPIFMAECVSNHANPRSNMDPDDDAYYEVAESETWTFYKFATIKGSVTLRWYGTSNGYYSEGVGIYKWTEDEE